MSSCALAVSTGARGQSEERPLSRAASLWSWHSMPASWGNRYRALTEPCLPHDKRQIDVLNLGFVQQLPHLSTIRPVPCTDIQRVIKHGGRVVPVGPPVVAAAETVGVDLGPRHTVRRSPHLHAGHLVERDGVERVAEGEQGLAPAVLHIAEA